MSLEAPEIRILGIQLSQELPGKKIAGYELSRSEKMQKIGFMNRDSSDYERMIGRIVGKVDYRGMAIVIGLDKRMNLVLAPEYGGEIRLHKSAEEMPKKFHFKIEFTDGGVLSVRLKSMGGILALDDEELLKSWAFARDMEGGIYPLDESEFTFENFSHAIRDNNTGMKTILVGKDAVVVGFGNAAYQEIIFQAKIHPKRKGVELKEKEIRSLFKAIETVIKRRLAKKGKDEFVDLYGTPGKHKLIMGSNFRDQPCPRCGTTITRAAMGGGHVHFCSSCQKLG
ncbi:MAG: hypothetical protein JSW61_13275 [Candidatus Thorarchaeota archaeon]|nr:MAG: hypothetical protein JSW61_13275 [Candidatus Thorarchaeota archaeon]